MAASNPPAEPPMPTIGQPKFLFVRLERDVFRGVLDCADFLRFDFVCDRDALFDVGFAAIGFVILMAAHFSDKL